MPADFRNEDSGLELLFLGSGNAFSLDARSHNAFLANGRYLFDAGPGVLLQMHKAKIDPNAIDVIFISHFHADHFFGLPFLFLHYWRFQRTADLYVVGPPGIAERAEQLMELGFPGLPPGLSTYERRYIEVEDGSSQTIAGIEFTAVEVEHVPALRCFGYMTQIGGRALAYSGDAIFCPALLRLAEASDVLVLDCNCGADPVHLSQSDIAEVRRRARPEATTIVSHLDKMPNIVLEPGILVATDLQRFHL